MELFGNIYKKKLWISFKENALLYQNRYIIDCETSITFFITLEALGVLEICSKFTRNTLPKCNFNKFALQLYWNHSSACCIFSEHLFLRTPLESWFCNFMDWKTVLQYFYRTISSLEIENLLIFHKNLAKRILLWQQNWWKLVKI